MTRAQQQAVVTLDALEGRRAVAQLSKHIGIWMKLNRKEHTYKYLAKKAGLADKTVAKIWERVTVSPRLQTVVMLYHALGYALVAQHESYYGSNIVQLSERRKSNGN